MQRRYMIHYWLCWIIVIQCTDGVEIFLKQKNQYNDTIQSLSSFTNRTYQIPLFQTRWMIIRMNPNTLQRHGDRGNRTLLGWKFQIQSTDPRVLQIEKEFNSSTHPAKKILLEDLFIVRKNNALEQIFNVYPTPQFIWSDHQQMIELVWSIETTLMEETNLTIRLDLFYENNSISSHFRSLNVLVTQPKRVVDKIFYIILPFLVIFISTQMGILLDTKVMLDLMKNPKCVLIGFVAQYGLMPFLAMGIAKVFHYSPLHSLALFIIGCCPGSGASNQWTLLFDGDVNLSAVMSFVSTASSFVMMPLYFYTIGRIYMDQLAIRVPFLGLLRSLALVVVPYSIGILISHWSPKTRAVVERLVKPMMLFLLIFFLVFGSVVNWYMFRMIDLHTFLTAPLLPYLGFFFGALLAWICGVSWTHVKTIGIEAGIQNTGIAFMIMFYSFPQPYATKATIVPLVVAFLTTKPFWIVYMIRSKVKKYQQRKALNDKSDSSIVDSLPETKATKPSEKPAEVAEKIQNL